MTRRAAPPLTAFLVVALIMGLLFWMAHSSKGFESWSTQLTGYQASPGEVTLTVKVTSTGTETLPTTCVGYLSTITSTELGQGSVNVPPVAPGKSAVVTIPIPLHREGAVKWYWIECAGE